MPETYVAKPIGVRKLTWFPLTADPEDGTAATYAAAAKLSRLINITITPFFAEGKLESDDGVEDDMALLMGYDVAISASQLTDSIRASLLGHAFDAGGGILTDKTDVAQLGALAWEELLSKANPTDANKYKKVVLYKGKFREFAETANSVVESGVTMQTHGLVGRFYARNDGHVKYSIREDTASANATKLGAWFTTPQEYTAAA